MRHAAGGQVFAANQFDLRIKSQPVRATGSSPLLEQQMSETSNDKAPQEILATVYHEA
jgi:hypothetical protein